MGNKHIDPKKWKKKYSNKEVWENYRNTLEFRENQWIPCSMSIFPSVWKKYRKDLLKIVKDHPFIFGTLAKHKKNFDNIPQNHQPNTRDTDLYGCEWYVAQGGYEGQVVGHPLDSWDKFDAYEFPDPLKYHERGRRSPFYWLGAKAGAFFGNKLGIKVGGAGERLFDRLYFLRGFDNLMRDFATNNPNLPKLIEKFEAHEMRLVQKWLQYKPDIISFHTDIGTQDRLMISPRMFRKYIKPMFFRLFQACREAGTHVYLSSDGNLLEIVDDLVECGVSVHDPQERANTIKGIKERYKGKLCIDLDLDRQAFPFSTTDEIHEQIEYAVKELNSPNGGFMMKAEIADVNIPLKNIKAICNAFEEFCIPDK